MAMINSKYTVDPPLTNLLSYLFDAPYNVDSGWPETEQLLLSARDLNFPGYTITEIESLVRRLGCGLNHLGCSGKPVMVYGSDNINFCIAVLGVVAAGAACNVLASSPVEYLVARLRQLNCDTVLCAPQDADIVSQAAKELGFSHLRLFVVDESLQADHCACQNGGIRHWSYLLDTPGGETYEWPKLSESEAKATTAFLIYTSGTTGTSKLAERTHYSLIGSIESTLFHMNLEQTNREVMACQYKFSGMGFLMIGILIPLKARYKTIFPPSVFPAPKNILRAILAMSESPDLRSVRHVPTGGAVISYELIDEWQTAFGSQVQSLYGMTEAGFFSMPEPTSIVRDASVGVLLPSVEAKILDDTGALAPRSLRGNVYMRSPFVMKGYLNEPDQTAATVSADGWIRTGDIGWIDEKDQLYVVGRSKDLFKINGDSITAAEIEAAILQHPEVEDVAVIPVVLPGDPEPVPRGYIVKSPSSSLRLCALSCWMKQSQAGVMELLGGASFIDAIPIANLGNSKVDRQALAKLAEEEIQVANGCL
ncbi:acetyl-CoA synthetase-like protein [Aspergillus heterothallicus]